MNSNIGLPRNKKALIAIAVAAFIIAGGATYILANRVAPRENPPDNPISNFINNTLGGSSNSSSSASQPSQQQQAEKAKQSFDEGMEALAGNDPKTAIIKLTEAKELYTQIGDTEQAAMAEEQITVAEHEEAAQKANPIISTPNRASL